MIRAVFGRDRVTVTGHAGYAPKGQDIVCAAASALVFALIGSLRQEENLREVVIRPGYVTAAAKGPCREELELVRCGLAQLAAQEEQVRQVYPEFRWQREMENPAFGRLVCAGVEPMAAYEVVHREDILRRAMAYSAKRATRQAARSIASVGRRPAENGGRCVGVTGSDPRGLTSRELADIRRRVMEGEKISF